MTMLKGDDKPDGGGAGRQCIGRRKTEEERDPHRSVAEEDLGREQIGGNSGGSGRKTIECSYYYQDYSNKNQYIVSV
jgi:hypothetical protein